MIGEIQTAQISEKIDYPLVCRRLFPEERK